MSLSLTVLGCDGGYPGPGGAGSGYLVRSSSAAICLDMGPGVLAALQHHLDPSELAAVVVSHEHPDHSMDLEGLAVALHFVEEPRRVAVFAPAGIKERMYFQEWSELEWHEVRDGDRVEVAGMALAFARTDHGPETLAVRVETGGRSLGYSADTGPNWSFTTLGPSLDLALCEATWTRHQEGRAQHLSGRQAGSMAREAGARHLVITHRWPTAPLLAVADEAATAFGDGVACAHPGATYTLPSPSRP